LSPLNELVSQAAHERWGKTVSARTWKNCAKSQECISRAAKRATCKPSRNWLTGWMAGRRRSSSTAAPKQPDRKDRARGPGCSFRRVEFAGASPSPTLRRRQMRKLCARGPPQPSAWGPRARAGRGCSRRYCLLNSRLQYHLLCHLDFSAHDFFGRPAPLRAPPCLPRGRDRRNGERATACEGRHARWGFQECSPVHDVPPVSIDRKTRHFAGIFWRATGPERSRCATSSWE